MPEDDRRAFFYRRHLPHWRADRATYFVTWRLARGQAELDPAERTIVADAIRHFIGVRYEIIAFVVMNDHVHSIVVPLSEFSVEGIVHAWKSFTAHAIRKGRTGSGPVWQREYFDRVIRDDRELQEKRLYILANPFKRWPEIDSYLWVWPLGD
ncbi:MAG TPA: transposase [Candidatus Binataceae bacterium]|nr:transposase [Candidatus Binataceae bacterium]